MVLETIDTTFNTAGDVNTDTPKVDLLSPLSICTQAITPKPDVREDTAYQHPVILSPTMPMNLLPATAERMSMMSRRQ